MPIAVARGAVAADRDQRPSSAAPRNVAGGRTISGGYALIIGGPAASSMPADRDKRFAEAVRRKLLLGSAVALRYLRLRPEVR
jgi:hypothetical protein